MARLPVRFPDLVITSGQTNSNAIETDVGLGQNIDYTFYAPATLPETLTVEMSPVNNPSAGDWQAIQRDGTDITLTADKATLVAGMCKAMRVVAGGAVGADRTVRVLGQVEVA